MFKSESNIAVLIIYNNKICVYLCYIVIYLYLFILLNIVWLNILVSSLWIMAWMDSCLSCSPPFLCHFFFLLVVSHGCSARTHPLFSWEAWLMKLVHTGSRPHTALCMYRLAEMSPSHSESGRHSSFMHCYYLSVFACIGSFYSG